MAVVEALLVGGLEDLLASLLHLAGHLGVDAVGAAAVKTEAVRFGKFISAHQGKEVGVAAVLEHFACGFRFGIIAFHPGEQVAATDQGGTQGGLGHAAALAGFDQHAGIAGMHGQAQHLAPDGGEIRVFQSAEHGEEVLGAFDGLGIRFVQPVKGSGFPDS